jgi:hypothetical protein
MGQERALAGYPQSMPPNKWDKFSVSELKHKENGSYPSVVKNFTDANSISVQDFY